jgi:methylmalonyl-CoA mutase
LARRIAETGCRIAVVAGSDTDYRDSLTAVLRAARDGGATSVFLAGRPRQLLAELPEGLIDGTVAVGDDVLAFLGTVREAVGAAS